MEGIVYEKEGKETNGNVIDKKKKISRRKGEEEQDY